MPLRHIYLVTKRIHAIALTYLFGLLREYMPLQHIYLQHIYLLREYMPLQHIYLVTNITLNTCHCNISIWLLREYMPLQHIYLVTKRIHAIATYLFGY